MCRNNYRLPLRGTILNSGRGGGLAKHAKQNFENRGKRGENVNKKN